MLLHSKYQYNKIFTNVKWYGFRFLHIYLYLSQKMKKKNEPKMMLLYEVKQNNNRLHSVLVFLYIVLYVAMSLELSKFIRSMDSYSFTAYKVCMYHP